MDDRIDELSGRLAAIEKQLSKKPAEDKKHRQTLVQQITLPISLICATIIIVAVLRLLG